MSKRRDCKRGMRRYVFRTSMRIVRELRREMTSPNNDNIDWWNEHFTIPKPLCPDINEEVKENE